MRLSADGLHDTGGIVGLGFVGLTIAVAFGNAGRDVIGFDVNCRRIEELDRAVDRNGEVDDGTLRNAKVHFTLDAALLERAAILIVAVPTPLDRDGTPNLSSLKDAC